MKHDNRLKQIGFTLIEIVVTIAIISIITMMAMPRIQSLLAQQEMSKITMLIPQILRSARHEAFLHRKDVVVCSSIDGEKCANHSLWQDYVIVFVDSNKNRQRDNHELLLKNEELDLKYATMTRLGARHANYIMFKQSNALPQGSQGSFYYCSFVDKSLNRRIVLNGMGWYRIEKVVTCD